MIEFNSLCFLQNQKTGCTFIELFLRKFCVEGIRRYEKHSPARKVRPGVFYFLSVREPLDAYSSLFRYGLDGKGEIFMRLRHAGQGQLYAQGLQGFPAWLRYVLDADNVEIVMPDAPPALSARLGLKSWRFLRLAVAGLDTAAPSLTSQESIRDFAAGRGIADHVIQYERMKEQVLELVDGPLSHAFDDRNAIAQWLARAPRINASTTAGPSVLQSLPSSLLEEVQRREWFLYESFYGTDFYCRNLQ